MSPWLSVVGMFGLVWWVIFAAVSVLIMSYMEREYNNCNSGDKIKGTTIFLFLFLIFCQLFTEPTLYSTVSAHPAQKWLYAGLGYLFFGILYALWRWWRLCCNVLKKSQELEKEFLETNRLDPDAGIPEEKQQEFRDFFTKNLCRSGYSYTYTADHKIDFRPKHYHNKERISLWLSFWPWSLTLYIAKDFVHGVFCYIREKLSGLMDSVSRSVFKNQGPI